MVILLTFRAFVCTDSTLTLTYYKVYIDTVLNIPPPTILNIQFLKLQKIQITMVNSSQDAPRPAASAGDADSSYTGSPFVTQTSVVESLNKALADLQSPDDTSNAPHFELQKRLPNGNTRRATTEELQAADMESKLQQAAAQVEYLKTWDEKKQWAEEQRQYGNQLYREERYEQAIDVYLTCLVVAQQEKKLAPRNGCGCRYAVTISRSFVSLRHE
jgi:hypothetical protein